MLESGSISLLSRSCFISGQPENGPKIVAVPLPYCSRYLPLLTQRIACLSMMSMHPKTLLKMKMILCGLLILCGCAGKQESHPSPPGESAHTMFTAAAAAVASAQVSRSVASAESAVSEWAYGSYGLGGYISTEGDLQAMSCVDAPMVGAWYCARDGDRERYYCADQASKPTKQPCPLDAQAYPSYCYSNRDLEEATCQPSSVFDPTQRGRGRLEAGSSLWDEHREHIAPYIKSEIWGKWSSGSAGCCRVCKKGKPCGNSCIARNKTCRVGPGCAC